MDRRSVIIRIVEIQGVKLNVYCVADDKLGISREALDIGSARNGGHPWVLQWDSRVSDSVPADSVMDRYMHLCN